MSDTGVADILLVEDNPGDVRLTREALRDGGLPHNLSVVTDGEAAMDFLCRRGEYSEAVRPGLILLDVHLPRKAGTEVLREVKGDPALRHIPVIVLTSSTPGSDPEGVLELGADRYLPKPAQLDEFLVLVRAIEDLLPRG